MEFIKEEDLQLIATCANQDVNETDFAKLKLVYEKLEHICVLLQEKGFDYQIRKDPRRQAGQGVFKFQEYHWAKIYPTEYKHFAQDKFAYIIGFTDVVHFHLMGIKDYQEMPASRDASKTCWTELDIEESNYENIIQEFVAFDKKYRPLFIKTGAALGIEQFKNIVIAMKNTEIKELLEYKKQIILQGPPGTGKTRKAKEITRELLLPKEITVNEIIANIKVGMNIYSATDKIRYIVENISETNITLLLESGSKQTPTFQKIIEAYKMQKWNGGTTGGDAYETAVAKYIYETILPKEQFKLIQFHPSYSYEDFVRGITAQSKGTQIEYIPKNKILAEFAAEALKNYRDSKQNTTVLSKEKWVEHEIELFAEKVQEEIENNGKYAINDTVSIFEVEEDAFRYKGNTWDVQSLQRMKFKDIALAYLANVANRQDIKQVAGISGRAREHASYDFKLLEKFRAFLTARPAFKESEIKVEEEKYVLIIDEINRANLSSVLGELIYALEYRGEAVESMYAVDDDNKLILPPNLYIIGTMNTADRSVGNIDYAIRRRFAFVDVLPEDLSTTLEDKFNKVLFDKVSALFNHNTYLSKEFEAKDVQLGHSYFIDKTDKGATMQMRLEYEIKPILKEYVKDGVLVGDEVKDEIEKLAV